MCTSKLAVVQRQNQEPRLEPWFFYAYAFLVLRNAVNIFDEHLYIGFKSTNRYLGLVVPM